MQQSPPTRLCVPGACGRSAAAKREHIVAAASALVGVCRSAGPMGTRSARWRLLLLAQAFVVACRAGAPAPQAELRGPNRTLVSLVREGAPNPTPQTFRIENTGTCALAFTVSSSTSDGAPWLSASPASGVVASGDGATITVAFDSTGPSLGPGTYTGSVLVSAVCQTSGARAARSPADVGVNLTVRPAYCADGPPAASDVTCDGVDDDCNGRIDDGFVRTVTTCGVGVCASAGERVCLAGQVRDTCTPLCDPPGSANNPRPSCAQILAEGGSIGDGVYHLRQSGGLTYRAYCDMTTDGGGWTAIFVGKNGSPNVFDHFDDGAYAGTFSEPSSAQYLQRLPASAANRAAELAVTCGSTTVAFAMTKKVYDFFSAGTQQGWLGLTPRVVTGVVLQEPNSLYTGTSGGARGFVFAKNQTAGGSTFASSHAESMAYDFCGGAPNTTSTLRVLFRELPATPTYNTPATARLTCGAILRAGGSSGDGHYWLSDAGGGAPYLAYCDMTTDGGGWTAVYAGRNGSANVWDHFDGADYSGACPDPATRCLRRAPPLLGSAAAEFAVSCGTPMVSFPLTEPARSYFMNGTQAGWIPITPRVVRGTVLQRPDTLFTGTSEADRGFIVSRGQVPGVWTFASSRDTDSTYDICVGSTNNATIGRIFYREATPAPERNTASTAVRSCQAALLAQPGADSGLYWLVEPSGAPYLAYCDMSNGGGGWTAIYAGRNGSQNRFDHFEQSRYQGLCPDPASRCTRRPAPTALDTAASLAVACGARMVSFPVTEPMRRWLLDGAAASWLALTPTVLMGTILQVPTTLFTGDETHPSFVFARNQQPLGNTFASTSDQPDFDGCSGSTDNTSMLRLFYREAPRSELRNAPSPQRTSCRAVRDAGEGAGDGLYWLAPDGVPKLTYCDMTTDGGGWTAVLAARNGAVNAFDHLDANVYQGLCTDPATRCVRRAPATLSPSSGELAVSCADAMVAFPMNSGVHGWLTAGAQSGWVNVTPRLLVGTPLEVPNTLFTGTSSTDASFVVARGQGTGRNTFASTHPTNVNFNACKGLTDVASMLRVFYRE